MDHNAYMVVVALSNSPISTSGNLYSSGRDSNSMEEKQMIWLALAWLWCIGLMYTMYTIIYDSEKLDDDDPRF